MPRTRPTITIDLEDYKELTDQKKIDNDGLPVVEAALAYTHLLGLSIQEPSMFSSRKPVSFTAINGVKYVAEFKSQTLQGAIPVEALFIRRA